MLERVKKYIAEQGLINPGELIIAGVSGGPDSMALLHILQRLVLEMGHTLAVAHLNHGLRPEAGNEELFVARYCEKWNIPFYAQTRDVRAVADAGGMSVEEAGRYSRYQFFLALQAELGASAVATAHHRGDRAEGVLMNLLRGSGIKGLRGIMPRNGSIIRPLLCVNRDDIMAYLRQQDLPYCIDSSNQDPVYLRNRIRHQLLPLLQQDYNPAVEDSLNRLADLARDENEVLEQESARRLAHLLVEQEPEGLVLDLSALQVEPPAYQRRIIMLVLARLRGESGWSLEDVESVRTLLKNTGEARHIKLKKNLVVTRSYRRLEFTGPIPAVPRFSYPVPVPGTLLLSECSLRLEFILTAPGEFEHNKDDICLDYGKINKELLVRSRRPGDRFRPSGMEGSKKIKDYFMDIKLPRFQRDRVPLLASADGHIYAVLGFRVAEDARMDPETRTVLLVKFSVLPEPD